MDKFCEHYASKEQKLEESVILEKRERILKKVNRYLLSGSEYTEVTPQNFKRVVTADRLRFIAKQIDLEFFDYKLIETLNKNGCCISFCMGNACGSTAGFCSYRKGVKPEDRMQLSIKMMPNVFIQSFKNVDIKLRAVDNTPCRDILTCFLLTLCHELVHAIIFCNCKDFNKSDKGPGNWKGLTRPGNGHSKTFMSILNNRYGHKTFTHNLHTGVTVEKLEGEVFGSHNVKVGDIIVLNVRQFDGSFKEEKCRVLSAGKVILKAVSLDDPNSVYRGRFYTSILRKETGSPKKSRSVKKTNTPTPPRPKTPTPPRPKTPTPPRPKTPTPTRPKTPSPVRKTPTPPRPKTPTPPRPKTPSPVRKTRTPPRPKTPTPPRPKTPSPPRRKTSTSSNNKPLVLPKKPKTKRKIIRKKQKGEWSDANPDTFLRTYASKKRFSTLEEAKKEGLIDSNVGGITKSGKKEVYSLRKGKTLGHSPSGEVSWLKL